MSKTMSIRMDRENFEFLNELTKEQRVICPKPCGTWLPAVESYLRWNDTKKGRHLLAEPLSLPESPWER